MAVLLFSCLLLLLLLVSQLYEDFGHSVVSSTNITGTDQFVPQLLMINVNSKIVQKSFLNCPQNCSEIGLILSKIFYEILYEMVCEIVPKIVHESVPKIIPPVPEKLSLGVGTPLG